MTSPLIYHSTVEQSTSKMFKCRRCGEDFARKDNLTRHKKRRYDCDANTSTDDGGGRNQVCKSIRLNRRNSDDFSEDLHSAAADDDIPYFDGDEFCDNKPKTRETLNKMMKLLRIPEHRWNRIATDILTEDHTKHHI